MSKLAPPVARFAQSAIALAERETDEIKAELVAVSSASDSMFGVERLARNKLDTRAHRLRRESEMAGTGYKRLSLEPLSWKKEERFGITLNRYPMFAIYTLSSPYMVIRSKAAVINNNGSWLSDQIDTLLPSPLPVALQEIYSKHRDERDGGKSWRITSTFQGVIPKEVREDIRKAEPFFTRPSSTNSMRTNIFLIGEAEWVEGYEPEPPPLRHFDPLVVGWDDQDLWLITVFDLTDIERYMVAEFPALPAHTNELRLPEHK